jgi:hypothetical protein
MWLQYAIIIGVVVLFIGSYMLNNRVKVPEGTELPEGCSTCTQTSCVVKTSTAQEKKDELKRYLASLDECKDHVEHK